MFALIAICVVALNSILYLIHRFVFNGKNRSLISLIRNVGLKLLFIVLLISGLNLCVFAVVQLLAININETHEYFSIISAYIVFGFYIGVIGFLSLFLFKLYTYYNIVFTGKKKIGVKYLYEHQL